MSSESSRSGKIHPKRNWLTKFTSDERKQKQKQNAWEEGQFAKRLYIYVVTGQQLLDTSCPVYMTMEKFYPAVMAVEIYYI